MDDEWLSGYEMKRKGNEYIKLFCSLLLSTVLLTAAIAGELRAQSHTADSSEQSHAAEYLQAAAQTAVTQETENSTNIQLYARSAVLMDADSGRVLFGRNEKEQMPMASTTKIMTCILALENGNMEDIITVSAYAAGQPKVHLGMHNGQQFRLKDLMYSLMLESHNDSAVAIAEHIGGSVEGFAEMMNRKAEEIGCPDTFFITPNGLDAAAADGTGEQKVHSTTATDLARMMRYCIRESEKSEEFLELTRTGSYSFTDSEGKRSYSCNNHNAFLHMMDGALSGKTGFTNNAGYCYVGALEREGKTFIVALLACGWPNNKSYKWSDTKKLMNYGLENYEYVDVYEPAEIPPLIVEEGVPENGKPYGEAAVPVREENGAEADSMRDAERMQDAEGSQEAELRVLLKEGEKVERREDLPDKLTAPVESGQTIGYVRYFLEGELLKEYPVKTEAGVEKMDFRWICNYIWKLYSL